MYIHIYIHMYKAHLWVADNPFTSHPDFKVAPPAMLLPGYLAHEKQPPPPLGPPYDPRCSPTVGS